MDFVYPNTTNLTLNEETHTYTDTKGTSYISVTTLLQEVGIAPTFPENAKKAVSLKAERGTLIHREIHDYVELGAVGFTKELGDFIKWFNGTSYEVISSEKPIAREFLAGTPDIVFHNQTGNHEYFIADIKTTAKQELNYWTWQLSLYAWIMGLATPFGYILWFKEGEELQVIQLPLKKHDEVRKLIDDYGHNKPVEIDQINVPKEVTHEIVECEKQLEQLTEAMKTLKEKEEQFKEQLLNLMKENGVLQWKNKFFTASYVAPTTRNTIDTTRLKKELPNIYKNFLKTSEVKENIRITLKKGNK